MACSIPIALRPAEMSLNDLSQFLTVLDELGWHCARQFLAMLADDQTTTNVLGRSIMMTLARPPMFSADHRAMLERYAARGCPVSRYMLDHNLLFPEALEAMHSERCAEPVPVPDLDEETRIGMMIDKEEWR